MRNHCFDASYQGQQRARISKTSRCGIDVSDCVVYFISCMHLEARLKCLVEARLSFCFFCRTFLLHGQAASRFRFLSQQFDFDPLCDFILCREIKKNLQPET